jgi:hypothetical protein
VSFWAHLDASCAVPSAAAEAFRADLSGLLSRAQSYLSQAPNVSVPGRERYFCGRGSIPALIPARYDIQVGRGLLRAASGCWPDPLGPGRVRDGTVREPAVGSSRPDAIGHRWSVSGPRCSSSARLLLLCTSQASHAVVTARSSWPPSCSAQAPLICSCFSTGTLRRLARGGS